MTETAGTLSTGGQAAQAAANAGTAASLAGAEPGKITTENTSLVTGNQAFLESLPQEYRDAVRAKGWKAPADAIKSYLELESFSRGGPREELVRISKEPTQEQLNEVFTKIGRPASAKDYKFGEEVSKALDKSLLDGFADQAHKMGLSQTQADALTKWFYGSDQERAKGIASKMRDEAASAMQKSLGILQKEWGTGFDQNMNLVQRALRFHGDQELIDEVNRTGIGNSPAFAKFLLKVADGMKDDAVFINRGSQGFSNTTQEAKAELNKIKQPGTEQNKLFMKGDPATVERWHQLQRVLAGEA